MINPKIFTKNPTVIVLRNYKDGLMSNDPFTVRISVYDEAVNEYDERATIITPPIAGSLSEIHEEGKDVSISNEVGDDSLYELKIRIEENGSNAFVLMFSTDLNNELSVNMLEVEPDA